MTIPFFAEARNAASIDLNQQKDDTNKQTINPGANGAEAYMYFGCWLDINQPNDLRSQFSLRPPMAVRSPGRCSRSQISFGGRTNAW